MEFPELGVHCAESSCSRLDFLPFTCDACHKVFCLDHKTYEQHKCTESYSKDVHVPVCPLCTQPVPVRRGEDPNIKVDQHIHNDCKSEAAKKLYTNKCSYKGCKKKEVVQVNCNTCRKTFCLKHRFETDHACEGPPNRLARATKTTGTTPQATTLSSIGADLNRARQDRQRHPVAHVPPKSRVPPKQSHVPPKQSHVPPKQSHVPPKQSHVPPKQSHVPPKQSHVPPKQSASTSHVSEDQALAAAIAASLSDSPTGLSQPSPEQDEDEALARAIAASLQDPPPNKSPQKKEDESSCRIS